jgi:hypothetical protein
MDKNPMSYPKFEAQRVARLARWKVTVTGETAAQRGAINHPFNQPYLWGHFKIHPLFEGYTQFHENFK